MRGNKQVIEADELAAVLRFRANPGAVTDLFSELTIANLVLSDSTGAGAVSRLSCTLPKYTTLRFFK